MALYYGVPKKEVVKSSKSIFLIQLFIMNDFWDKAMLTVLSVFVAIYAANPLNYINENDLFSSQTASVLLSRSGQQVIEEVIIEPKVNLVTHINEYWGLQFSYDVDNYPLQRELDQRSSLSEQTFINQAINEAYQSTNRADRSISEQQELDAIQLGQNRYQEYLTDEQTRKSLIRTSFVTQSTLNDQFISNLEPFSIYHYQGRTKFGPAFLKINEGSLETNLELQNGLLDNGHFQMVNVDLKGIGKLVGKTLPVSGSAFADFTAMTINDVFSFEGSLQIRDGIWEEMKFSIAMSKTILIVRVGERRLAIYPMFFL